MEDATRDQAQRLLGELTGSAGAVFREGQLEAIASLVDEGRRVLVVQRTGWGKSAVYFIATRILRDRGAGTSVLVSPLLALMRNQVEMAARAGVRAATINSANRDEWDSVEDAIRDGSVDLVLVSPERLNNPRFRADVLPRLLGRTGLLIVDEAHCISDWGHDFRPDYRRVASVIDALGEGVPVLCTTATANQRVIDDVVHQLGSALVVQRGTLERESLRLSVARLPTQAQRLAWLAAAVPSLPGSGIVYCLTIGDTERVARWLTRKGIAAMAYSGETADDDRIRVEAALASNTVKAVVATSALGMGYDKPDLGFVVHFQHPGSPIAYYQQVGRAGRAIAESFGVLLVGAEDVDIQDFFINTAFPAQEMVESTLDLLRAEGPLSTRALLPHVNVGQTRLEVMLKILEVEGAVERLDGAGWMRTKQPWAYDAERVASVTSVRKAEQRAMRDYIDSTGCLMEVLRRELDDADAGPCGRCANCTGVGVDVDVDEALVQEALEYLRGQDVVVLPRKQWIGGVGSLRGNIAAGERCEPGRALGVAGDGGWGTVVDRVLARDEPASDQLVDALARLVRAWRPDPPPAWITWVPSARRVVPDAAARLGSRLGIPAVDALQRVRDGHAQREMENSAQQLRNVHGAFALTGPVPSGPVLLLDDTVDSKWTMTVVGALLRGAGASQVFPLALAKSR